MGSGPDQSISGMKGDESSLTQRSAVLLTCCLSPVKPHPDNRRRDPRAEKPMSPSGTAALLRLAKSRGPGIQPRKGIKAITQSQNLSDTANARLSKYADESPTECYEEIERDWSNVTQARHGVVASGCTIREDGVISRFGPTEVDDQSSITHILPAYHMSNEAASSKFIQEDTYTVERIQDNARVGTGHDRVEDIEEFFSSR